MTGEQACETIVRAMKHRDLSLDLKPEEVWNASPTGELWHVWGLLFESLTYLESQGLPLTDEERAALEEMQE